MLDKLKLFNKDKDRSKTHLSKRTSSSSGFSSARSDSSLSLNNDSNIPSPSTAKSGSVSSKKSDVSNNTAKTSSSSSKSSSKIISSKGAKESSLPPPVIKSSSSSTSKKDKKENGDVKQKTTASVKFSQQINQKQMVRHFFYDTRARRDFFDFYLIRAQIQQPKAIIQPVTSIPKPMAAIKGTKQVDMRKEDQMTFDVIKTDKNLHNSNISLNSSASEQYQRTQVVNPINMSPKHNQLQSNASSSPQHSMNGSIHSNSTTRNNQSHSNSSESVIYRPGASDSGSDFYHSSAASNGTAISSAASASSSNNGGLQKFNTIPTKINGHVTTTIYEEDKHHQQLKQQQANGNVNGVPLRSIMRSYNNHVTLPTRGTRAGSAGQLYYEEGSQGYCSDGDALRKNQAATIRYTDIENGYLSEGGGVTNPHFMSIFRNRPQLPTTIEER